MKIDKHRIGTAFDPRYRNCSLADVSRSMKLTIAKVRSLEESALAKLRRQKRRDKLAQWAEAVRQEADARPTIHYQYLGHWKIEFEPVFMMEILEAVPGLPSFTKTNFRRVGRGRSRRVLVRSRIK